MKELILKFSVGLTLPYSPALVFLLVAINLFPQKQVEKSSLLSSDSFEHERINILNQSARKLCAINPDSAKTLGNIMLLESEKLNFKKGIAKAKETIARANMHLKSDSVSFKLAIDALNYAKEIGADSVYLDCINILGFWNYKNKRIDQVYKYNQLGLKFAKEKSHQLKTYLFTSNAASIFHDVKEYDKALEYFNQAQKILDQNPDANRQCQLYIGMAHNFIKKGDLPKAKEFTNKALTFFDEFKDKKLEIQANVLLGNIYNIEKEPKKAKKTFTNLLLSFKNIESSLLLSDVETGLAKTEYLLGNYENAIEISEKALKRAKKSKYYDGILPNLHTKFKIYQKINDFQTANKVLLEYHHILDSLNLKENENKLLVNHAEAILLKEQEILQLKLETNQTREKNTIIFATAIILGLLIFLLLLKRNENKLQVLNEQLEKSKMELEIESNKLKEANITKTRLLSIIGHDLRAPINSLGSVFDLFKMNKMSQKDFYRFLPKLKSDFEHLNFTLNNLLFWGRSQMNRITTEPKVLSLFSIMDNSIKLLSRVSESKAITITNKIPKTAKVLVDKDQMDIIARNLLSNAIKFTPKNGLVTVEAEEKAKNWEIMVRDTGIGMDKETQEKIFRSDTNTTTYGTNNEKGTGLGLSLCKEMVEKNKGSIWVKSFPKKGSCFYFTLPKADKKYKQAG